MIELHRWPCGHVDERGAPCVNVVTIALASPIGLRAIGWEVVRGRDGQDIIRCPLHVQDDEAPEHREPLERVLGDMEGRAITAQHKIANAFDEPLLRWRGPGSPIRRARR